MKVIVFMEFFIGGVIAAYFENVNFVDQSEVEIVLDEESPSLLTCTHKCLRMSAEVNFDPPHCRCFVYGKPFYSAENNEIMSGLLYQRVNMETKKKAQDSRTWREIKIVTKDTQPTKNNLMMTIDYFPAEYKISLQVNPKSYESQWQNVLHFSSGSGSGSGNYGSRNPGIWVSKSNWRVASAVNGGMNHGYEVNPVNVYKINKWIQIDVSQMKNDKEKYNYSITFNRKLVHYVINTQPQYFTDVRVFVSNPWHEPANCIIRSLSYSIIDDKDNEPFFIYSIGMWRKYRIDIVKDGVIEKGKIVKNQGMLFRMIRPGINGLADSISLESVSRKGYYLASCKQIINSGICWVSLRQYSTDYDFTWYIRPDKFLQGTVSFESARHSSYFIKHAHFWLSLSQDASPDSSFLIGSEACQLIETDYTGPPLREIKDVSSWQQCGRLCRNDNNCKYWIWFTERHQKYKTLRLQCHLKSSYKGIEPVLGITAGTQDCFE